MLGGLEFILFSALCLVNGIGLCEDCLPSSLQQAINCNGTVHAYAWRNETDTCTATQVLDCDSNSFASLEECMSYASSRGKHSFQVSYVKFQASLALKDRGADIFTVNFRW